jgi:hypothetical protein
MMKNYLLMGVAILAASTTAFGVTPWDAPNGAADSFSWANGQNDTNNFGSPVTFGDTFVFFTNFDAAASDAGTESHQPDTMDVDLDVLFAGDEFSKITLTMFGDYSMTNNTAPNDDNSVEADFDMMSDEPMPAGLSDNLNYFNDTPGSGSWSETAEIVFDTVGDNVTGLHLTVDGEVVAISDGAGGTASITANTTTLEIAITVIPEPASLALLALGGLALVRRR